MTVIPHFLLKRIYVAGSLRQAEGGLAFDLKNVLGPGSIVRLDRLIIDGVEYLPHQIRLWDEDRTIPAETISAAAPVVVPMNRTITCFLPGVELSPGAHRLTLEAVSKEAGRVSVSVEDTLV